MPQKAEFNPQRRQELANALRRATTQAIATRNHLRWHLKMSDPLYKEANEVILRTVALEKKATKEHALPPPQFEGVTEDKRHFEYAERIVKGQMRGLIP